MAVERRKVLRKADTPDDALAGMGASPAPAQVPANTEQDDPGVKGESAVAASAVPTQARRGPGRPRTRLVRVPFTNTIDIEVRERLDSWEYETGERIVDLLDRALRKAMGMPPAKGPR